MAALTVPGGGAPLDLYVRAHMPADSLLLTLRALECELHEPRARGSRERLAQLLHVRFSEFGRSGAVYTTDQVIAQLLAESIPA